MSLRAKQKPRFADPAATKRETVVGHLVGLILSAAGAGMILAGAVEWAGGGREYMALFGPGLGVGLPALLLYSRTKAPLRISPANIFGAILTAWLAFCLAASLPYLLSGALGRFDLALFEAVSGFTTTASTVMVPIDAVARGVLLWRAITQWFGGMAITVFVVSVLPYFRSAGFEHLAGISGGWGGERLASRVQETSKRLILLYVGFTCVVAAFYALFGMGAFDAIAHAFTTVSTGGFSTHDRSIAHFSSAGIEWTAIAGMLLAGGNFALYFQALRGRTFTLLRSVEMRVYLLIMFAVGGAAVLWNAPRIGWSHTAVRQTLFGSVSITTTTGYTLVDYDQWAGAVQLLLLFGMAIGGMAGGSAGGFKVFRLVAVAGHIRRHLFRQLHSRAVPVVRVGDEVIADPVITQILGFFGLFMAVGAIATFLISAIGDLDLTSSISAVTTSLGNVGPALGALGPTHHYLDVDAGVRNVLMVVMLAGRLELYPVLLGAVPLVRFLSDRLPPRLGQIFVRFGRG